MVVSPHCLAFTHPTLERNFRKKKELHLSFWGEPLLYCRTLMKAGVFRFAFGESSREKLEKIVSFRLIHPSLNYVFGGQGLLS